MSTKPREVIEIKILPVFCKDVNPAYSALGKKMLEEGRYRTETSDKIGELRFVYGTVFPVAEGIQRSIINNSGFYITVQGNGENGDQRHTAEYSMLKESKSYDPWGPEAIRQLEAKTHPKPEGVKTIWGIQSRLFDDD